VSDTPEPLTVDDAATLMEFARACKAAARAVSLYPAGHPAIAATLGRIVHVTSAEVLHAPLMLTVRPDGLLLGDRAPARADPAIAELALLFHSHLIGQAIVHPGGDTEAWHSFLLLLGRPPESIRAEGGIARLWAATARGHVELREIDYAEVLRERSAGESAVWHRIVAQCLRGGAFDLDADGVRELLDVAGEAGRLADVMSALDKTTSTDSAGAIGAKSAAVLRMLRAIVETVSAREPARLEPVLRNMATAVGQLSPDTLLGMLPQHDDHAQESQLMNAVVSRMSDGTIARFVARHVAAEGSATDRLALAFQALVPDQDHQHRLLALAHEDVAASPLGSAEDFGATWDHIAKQLLTSYSDEPYVTDAYARELTGTQAHAIDVEHVSDDPPERVAAWLSTIATTALRALDLSLLIDLLHIEQDEERWGALMTPLVRLLEDLLLVGDFEAARDLIAVLVREAGSEGSTARRRHAIIGIDMLIAGPMLRHVTTHLATADDAQLATITAMCVSVGENLVQPLAETLSSEDRPRTRERLTSILLAFGSVGRRTIERLKTSENPAIRRTAIYLIGELGGSHALPDLAELLDDTEPQVQRAAIRAILNVGTDETFRILERALATGSPHARDAIMHSIGAVRDERATPLFTYILRRVDHRGPLAAIYVRAIESLGALRDPAGISPLRDVLFRGEWWAPRRTAALRSAAAGALARIGTSEAISVLQDAATRGSRGVRAAARAHLTARGRRRGMREDRS
jgi:hypothetical protein